MSVNNISSGVLFCDITERTWARSLSMGNPDGQMLNAMKNSGNEVKQTFPHFLALMKDFSVVNPTDKDTEAQPEATQWLWNADIWGGP